MKAAVSLLAAALAAVVLAGCSGGAPPPAAPPLAAVPAAELAEGRFYGFRHDGGDLALALGPGGGEAEVVLFGGDDARIGRVALGDGRASGRFVLDGVPRGDLAVLVLALNGTLDVRSGGSAVDGFAPLAGHRERHVLLQRPLGPSSVVSLPLSERPADESVEVALHRAPATLRLLVQGSFQDLDVRLVGSAGQVLHAQDPGGPVQPVFGPLGLQELPAEDHGENVRDGRLRAHVVASHFEGVLLLEAVTFSRARPAGGEAAETAEVPRFTYGALPDQPVSFHVRQGTSRLYLLQEEPAGGPGDGGGCREPDEGPDPTGGPPRACREAGALVALFGPDDRRLATVAVPRNGTVAIPVDEAGEYVAALVAGQATLGADRVPADFELHPLDVRSTLAPSGPASARDGEYGQARQPVEADGVPFRVQAEAVQSGGALVPFLLGPASCGPATLVALQGGEAIGAWGFDELGDGVQDASASFLLRGGGEDGDGGGLEVVHDDFGPACVRIALRVDGYAR